MAIAIKMERTERVLFCSSKWWGDPEMPANMEYPMTTIVEDGEEYEYPLTFICQINCEDLAGLDKEGKLPKEGMLYFFGAVDALIGYESPYDTLVGEWEKGRVTVKYAKAINFETFNSVVMVDDDEESITDEAFGMTFSACEDDAPGIKLLGTPACAQEEGTVNFLQIQAEEGNEIGWDPAVVLNYVIKESDLGFGNFKKAKAVLTPIA